MPADGGYRFCGGELSVQEFEEMRFPHVGIVEADGDDAGIPSLEERLENPGRASSSQGEPVTQRYQRKPLRDYSFRRDPLVRGRRRQNTERQQFKEVEMGEEGKVDPGRRP